MHSNFITPPDYVETVLILNAEQEVIKHLGMLVQDSEKTYNVYFYRDEMNDQDWLARVRAKADVVLDAKLSNPLNYFNK